MKRALVTGGGGFLGSAVVRALQQSGVEVVSFSRHAHHTPCLHQCGSLEDADAVSVAVAGCDTVFHVAAKAGVWGAWDEYQRINVQGTKNIIHACRHHGVQRLIYTSSPSVVFDGQDMEGVDESVPYPSHYHAAYPRSKALAEQCVLAANSDALTTVALRPHLIWGAGDQHLVPRILARGRSGKLRRIGDRPCLVDTIYIDNAADAHILAAKKLHKNSALSGRAYFISNDEPIPLWDMVNRILAAGGVAAVTKTISPTMAYGIGSALERIYGMLGINKEPPMTRSSPKNCPLPIGLISAQQNVILIINRPFLLMRVCAVCNNGFPFKTGQSIT